jgi:hypothetical protein
MAYSPSHFSRKSPNSKNQELIDKGLQCLGETNLWLKKALKDKLIKALIQNGELSILQVKSLTLDNLMILKSPKVSALVENQKMTVAEALDLNLDNLDCLSEPETFQKILSGEIPVSVGIKTPPPSVISINDPHYFNSRPGV